MGKEGKRKAEGQEAERGGIGPKKYTNYETNPLVNMRICNELARRGSDFGRFGPGVGRRKLFGFTHLADCRHVVVALVWEVIHRGGGERDMNYVSQACEVGMMRFTLREDNETDFLGRAAEEILQLPSVLRVRTNPARQEIEITFKQPAEGLLRQVNSALQSVGTEMTASKVR